MKIGIVGLGYVGLPLATFCEAGHEVVGVDTDPRVADALAAGRSHVEDVPDEALAAISDFVPELPEHGLRSAWPEDVDCPVIDFRDVTRGIEASNLVRL